MNYKIFDLLYSELRHKFEDENCVFTQKYTVGKQRIQIHCLKNKNKIDPVQCLNFLFQLQKKLCLLLTGQRFTLAIFKHLIKLLFINS